MANQLNATPAINAFLNQSQQPPSPARAEAIRQGACRVCLQTRPECLSSECPTGPRCFYRELANHRFAARNPDTHCQLCHEPLSEYGHCWQHHWPPMDPSLDKPQTTDHAKLLAHAPAIVHARPQDLV